MNSNSKPYKTYPKEFKFEAIRLMKESDRPASEITRQLGIRRNQLYK
jgi:transposase